MVLSNSIFPIRVSALEQSISQTYLSLFIRRRTVVPRDMKVRVWDYPLQRPMLSFLAARYGLIRWPAKGRCLVLKYPIRDRWKVKNEIKVEVKSIYSHKKKLRFHIFILSIKLISTICKIYLRLSVKYIYAKRFY